MTEADSTGEASKADELPVEDKPEEGRVMEATGGQCGERGLVNQIISLRNRCGGGQRRKKGHATKEEDSSLGTAAVEIRVQQGEDGVWGWDEQQLEIKCRRTGNMGMKWTGSKLPLLSLPCSQIGTKKYLSVLWQSTAQMWSWMATNTCGHRRQVWGPTKNLTDCLGTTDGVAALQLCLQLMAAKFFWVFLG